MRGHMSFSYRGTRTERILTAARRAMTCVLLIVLGAPELASAQPERIMPWEANAAWFGSSVAIYGDTIVVGAPHSRDFDGLAEVFRWTGSEWEFEDELIPLDGAPESALGMSVDIHGNTAVVGAPWHTVGNNSSQGAVYVFVRSGTTWSQQAMLIAPDGGMDDWLGISVAIWGDTVIAGADAAAAPAINQGAVYIFTRSGATWSQQARLTASDGAEGDLFGHIVDVAGDTAAIGALQDDAAANNTDEGAAYIFSRSGATWAQQSKLTATDAAPFDNFGASVSLSGNTIIVGAPNDDLGGPDQGSAHVFTRSGATWTHQSKLTAQDGTTNDEFGSSVTILGDLAVIGAPLDRAADNSEGSSYVFVRSRAVWRQHDKLTTDGGRFGWSVDLDGKTLVGGAPVGGIGGTAWVFSNIMVPCPPDYNGDGFLNGDDFDEFVAAFELGGASADYDQNTFVNGDDYDLYVADFELGC